MPPIRRSKRRVKPYHPYSRNTLYIHGHGELRGGTHISFMVPHGVQIFIPSGIGVALSDDVGEDLMNGEGTPQNLRLAWIDRPGTPMHTPDGESERVHKFWYPMSCPDYTLLPPNGLANHGGKDDVFQTDVPILLSEIVEDNKDEYQLFVWSNCTVLRSSTGKPLTYNQKMDDLGDI